MKFKDCNGIYKNSKHTWAPLQSESKSKSEMGIKRGSEGAGSWRENVCLFPSTRAQHSLCTINFPTKKPAGLVTPSCFECLQWLNTYWSQGALEFSTSSAPWMVGSPIHDRKKPEPNFQAWVCFSLRPYCCQSALKVHESECWSEWSGITMIMCLE